MPRFTYQDMTLSVGMFGGEVTVQMRSLTKKVSMEDLAALLYPTFDAEEKAQAVTKS